MDLKEFFTLWNDLKKEYDANNKYEFPGADMYLSALSYNMNYQKDEASINMMPSHTLIQLSNDDDVLNKVNNIFKKWFDENEISEVEHASFDDIENYLVDVCKEWEKRTVLEGNEETLTVKQAEGKGRIDVIKELKREEKLKKEKEEARKEKERKKQEKIEREEEEKQEKLNKEKKEREQKEREQKEREQEEREQEERKQKEREQKEREQKEREQKEREQKEREQEERKQKERDIDEYLGRHPDVKNDDTDPDRTRELELEEVENLKIEKKLVGSISKEELAKKVTSIRDRIWDEAKKGDMGPVQNKILGSFTDASRIYSDKCNSTEEYYYWMENLVDNTETGSLQTQTKDDEYELKLNQVCDFIGEILDEGAFKDIKSFRQRYVEYAKKRFEMAESLDKDKRIDIEVKEADKKDENKIEDIKVEENKIEEIKNEEIKNEEIKTEEIKVEENNFRDRLYAQEFIQADGSFALPEALEDFAAIQDRKLSWGMKGNNADKFEAIKKSVAEYNDPDSSKNDYEKRKALYETCENYLRAHTSDGKSIDGQNTDVGRFRKQAVVEILQALEQYDDVNQMKEELEAAAQTKRQSEGKKPKERVKLSYKDLEMSLAKESHDKSKINKKDRDSIARKAYAELKAEKNKNKEEPKLGRNR